MHVSLFLAALLGVAGVSAVENPHKRAPPKRRAPSPNTQKANSAHGKRAYLSDKTKSEQYSASTRHASTNQGQDSPSMAPVSYVYLPADSIFCDMRDIWGMC